MTVRLPSRIKEGNKRCRGRYRYAGTSCSFSGGGAGVPLPYRSECVPSSASPARPFSPVPLAVAVGSYASSQNPSCLHLHAWGWGLVSRPVRVSGPIFFSSQTPPSWGWRHSLHFEIPPAAQSASIHSFSLHPAFCPAPVPQSKGFQPLYCGFLR